MVEFTITSPHQNIDVGARLITEPQKPQNYRKDRRETEIAEGAFEDKETWRLGDKEVRGSGDQSLRSGNCP